VLFFIEESLDTKYTTSAGEIFPPRGLENPIPTQNIYTLKWIQKIDCLPLRICAKIL